MLCDSEEGRPSGRGVTQGDSVAVGATGGTDWPLIVGVRHVVYLGSGLPRTLVTYECHYTVFGTR